LPRGKGFFSVVLPQAREIPFSRLASPNPETTDRVWIHPELRLPIKVVKLFSCREKEVVFLRNLSVDVSLVTTQHLPRELPRFHELKEEPRPSSS
jgi:hypothetical protein